MFTEGVVVEQRQPMYDDPSIDKYRSGATLDIEAPLSKIVAGTYFDHTASQVTNRNSTETAHVTGFSTYDHLVCLKYLRNVFSEGQPNSIKCKTQEQYC